MSIARVRAGQGIHYDHSDHLGSPAAQTYTNGGIATRMRYTPFGLTMDDPNLLKDQAGFTGHIKDSATGLTYMQARYYDPVMGRFLSIDPVTFMDTGSPSYFNRYAYTANDPINFIDPDGRKISSSSSVLENEDGTTTTTVDIKFTGALQNSSSSNLSSKKLGKAADRMASQIEKSFSGSSVDENGNTTVYNTTADITVGAATAGNERHNIEIVNADDSRMQGFLPTIRIAGQEPNYPLGSAAPGGNDIFLSQKTLSSSSQFKRTSTHEFGHSAGLLHPGSRGALPGIPTKNLMSQSRLSSSTKVLPAQLHKITN